MKKQPESYGYYVNENGYQGVVVQKTLEAAYKEDTEAKICDRVLEPLDAISPNAALETVIPETLETVYHLPVVDDQGALRGELSRSALVEVLADTEVSSTAA